MKTKLFTLFLALAASVGTILAESGTCGENLTWDLKNGVLTISGTGAMYDVYGYGSAPWTGRITSLIINDGVTSIGYGAFWGCSGLTSVSLGNSIISIGAAAFEDCTSLTSITIPNSVTSIRNAAFLNCTGLISVTFPNSVTSIGMMVFYRCTSLTSPVYNTHVFAYMPTSYSGSYTIPNGIETIAGSAFEECTSLTSIIIPNSVTSIGLTAFSNCTGLTSVTCEAATPPTMAANVTYNVFFGIDCSNIPLYVPAQSVEAYKAAEQWKEFNPILPIGSQTVDNVFDEQTAKSTKLLRDGQVLIFRADKTYTLTGQEVK